METEPRRTKVVILGGGFSGVYAAQYLERALSREELARVEISLVSKENYLVFQPMLPEIIGGEMDVLHAVSPIRRLIKHTRLYTREVEAIDLAKKTVTLREGDRPKPLVLEFDHLVLGLGQILDTTKVPGSAEHALPFKYLGDGLRLRNQLVHALEEADHETDANEKKKLLTFVVAGGGFSGVECAAELNEFVRRASRSYPNIRADEIRVVLLQSADRLLPEIKEKLATFAHRILNQRGVEIRLNTRLKAVSAKVAVIAAKGASDAERIDTRTVVSTVPAGPHPLVEMLALEKEKGRVRVNEFMEVPGHPGIWALGDCAAVMQRDGMYSPATAQHAIRQAKTCAVNIAAAVKGKAERKPFTFTGLGKLGSLGHGSAVAEIMGITFTGRFAWFLWRTIYLMKFPGWDRRVRIAVDWTLDLFLPRDITEVRIFEGDEVGMEHFEAGEIVFDQHDLGDKVYFIARGEADVTRGGEHLATLGKNEVFGEVALISDRPRTASIKARSALDVVSVKRAAFLQIVAHVPGVRPAMQEVMDKHLSGVDLEEMMGGEAVRSKPEVAAKSG